ncbi:MAG: type IX secretion system outer membrane channel protein PorV [Saprospiraceae bacterium]
MQQHILIDMNYLDHKNSYIRAFFRPLRNEAMKKSLFNTLFIVMLLGITQQVSAQCFFNSGTGMYETVLGEPCVNTIITAVPFLRIVPDARSAAMGDVGIATSTDANSMHFNGSKMVFGEDKGGVAVTYTPWLRALNVNDVYLAYLSGYYQLNTEEAVGFSLRYFSLGDIAFTDENGMPLGNGRPNEFELNGSYARKLGDKLSAGLGAKFIYSNLAAGQEVGGEQISAGTAFAADISMTYTTPVELSNSTSNLTLGVALTNLGSKITYTNSINKDFIPANFGMGAAWELNFDEFNSLTVAMDINKLMAPTPDPAGTDDNANGVPDYKEVSNFSGIFGSFSDAQGGISEELRELMYSVGLEYWYDKQFAVRAGYFYEHATKGNRKYFTVGLGLKYNVFGLNISYLVPATNQRNPLDNTLRFSMLFDFSAFRGDADL